MTPTLRIPGHEMHQCISRIVATFRTGGDPIRWSIRLRSAFRRTGQRLLGPLRRTGQRGSLTTSAGTLYYFSNSGAVSDDPALLIGGLNDTGGGAGSVANYAIAFAEANPGTLVNYLSWDQAVSGAGQAWLDALPNDVDVTMIGQSLGGWIAADLAAKNPGTIDTLITIDPVSPGWLPSSAADNIFQEVRASVGTWIDATQQNFGISLLSGLGFVTQWGNEVNGYASSFVQTSYAHGDFPYTMQYLYMNGYLPAGLNWDIRPPY